MDHEHATAKEVTRAETTRSWLLLFGVLGGPTAWAVQIIVAPDLAEVLCYPGAERSGPVVFGLALQPFIVVLSVVLTAVVIASGIAAFTCWRKLRRPDDAATGGRARWMAEAGMLVSALFLLSTVVGFLPVLFLDECVTSL